MRFFCSFLTFVVDIAKKLTILDKKSPHRGGDRDHSSTYSLIVKRKKKIISLVCKDI